MAAKSEECEDLAVKLDLQKPPDFYLVLDFEATCDDKNPPRPQEIIEFPVVMVNARTMTTDSVFHTYVRPTVHPQLTTVALKVASRDSCPCPSRMFCRPSRTFSRPSRMFCRPSRTFSRPSRTFSRPSRTFSRSPPQMFSRSSSCLASQLSRLATPMAASCCFHMRRSSSQLEFYSYLVIISA